MVCNQDQLEVTGALSTYEDRSDAGNQVFRKFCGTCGSPIFSELAAYPGFIALKVGTLNDSSNITPSSQVWCDSRQGWLAIDSDMPKFGQNRTE